MKKFQAICLKCSTRFEVRKGSGGMYHLLHCKRCGREKKVSMKDLPDLCRHSLVDYIRTCTHPEDNRNTSENEPGIPLIDERRYRFMVEHRAGLCVCGSMFKFSGKARCPRCRSSVYQLCKDLPA
ncbi:MAG TPA: hypothetical protein VMT44_02225 [Methanoregula sp.]|nr:hypothetical protein [Methanoregula sp.]